jgi:selenocysteine lyase/cysteine desulfurase
VDHLAGLAGLAGLTGSDVGSRRARVLASMAAVEAYEGALFSRLLDGLGGLAHVTLHGKAARRAPTAFFSVAGHEPRAVAGHLASRGVNVWNGNNYAYELCQVLGLQAGGAVRAGLVHYNDDSDVDRLLSAVAELAG